MYNELNHNVDTIGKIIENLNKGRRYHKSDTYVEHPQYFVWDSLKSSPSALTTPPKILEGVNEFYENSRIVLSKVDQRKDFKMSFSANDLEKQVSKLKEATIPLLEKNLQNLKEELIANEIELE